MTKRVRRRTSTLRAACACCALATTSAFSANSGSDLAKHGNASGAIACVTCHGERGEGTAAAGFPRLAALGATYIERQLDAFANGHRQNPVMAPIAKALQPDERAAVATYYAQLPSPGRFISASNASTPGAVLAQSGRWENGIVPACVECHGPDGIGVGEAFPPLAGQSMAYIAAQLHAWQQGTRPPGPLGLMHAIATRLSPAEIDAVAQYFGAMQPARGAAKDTR